MPSPPLKSLPPRQLALVGAILAWSRQSRLTTVALAGLLIAAAAYLRAEYLGLA